MSKKEIDYRFRYLYRQTNRCPKCCGLLEYQEQAGSMPPSIHCTACSWRYWGRESMPPTSTCWGAWRGVQLPETGTGTKQLMRQK